MTIPEELTEWNTTDDISWDNAMFNSYLKMYYPLPASQEYLSSPWGKIKFASFYENHPMPCLQCKNLQNLWWLYMQKKPHNISNMQ